MLLDTTHERHTTLQVLRAAISALSSVIGRNTEILLHDLERPQQSVLAIANGHISGRKVGSPILGGPGAGAPGRTPAARSRPAGGAQRSSSTAQEAIFSRSPHSTQ